MTKLYEFKLALRTVTVYGRGDNEAEALEDAEDNFCRDYLTKDLMVDSYEIVSVEEDE